MSTTGKLKQLLRAVTGLPFPWKRNLNPISSFWDVVRNPAALTDLGEYHKAIDCAATALSGSPEKIASLVDRFVFESKSPRETDTERRILAKLELESYPRALELLRDRSLKDRLTELKEGEFSLPEGPINRLCKIFDQDAAPSAEAAVLLSPFLDSDHEEVRKSAALIIGSISSPDSLPDLRRLLIDKAEYVRSSVLQGIKRAIRGGRISEAFRDELFTQISAMWPGDTSFAVCGHIPEVLLKLDRVRGTASLTTDEVFSTPFPPFFRILEAFDEQAIEVSRGRLLAVINEARVEPIKHPMTSVLKHALPLLAAHRNPADLSLFDELLQHNNERLVSGTTAALYRFHSYEERIRDPRLTIQQLGWQALTTTETHLCAIEELNAQVNNGGFAQYYFNSAGDHWQDALDGLAAIGAKERHGLMLTTVDHFGADRPAVERDARMAQLSAIVRRKQDPFRTQDDAWYANKYENLDRLKLRYNLANLEGREKLQSETGRGEVIRL